MIRQLRLSDGTRRRLLKQRHSQLVQRKELRLRQYVDELKMRDAARESLLISIKNRLVEHCHRLVEPGAEDIAVSSSDDSITDVVDEFDRRLRDRLSRVELCLTTKSRLVRLCRQYDRSAMESAACITDDDAVDDIVAELERCIGRKFEAQKQRHREQIEQSKRRHDIAIDDHKRFLQASLQSFEQQKQRHGTQVSKWKVKCDAIEQQVAEYEDVLAETQEFARQYDQLAHSLESTQKTLDEVKARSERRETSLRDAQQEVASARDRIHDVEQQMLGTQKLLEHERTKSKTIEDSLTTLQLRMIEAQDNFATLRKQKDDNLEQIRAKVINAALQIVSLTRRGDVCVQPVAEGFHCAHGRQELSAITHCGWILCNECWMDRIGGGTRCIWCHKTECGTTGLPLIAVQSDMDSWNQEACAVAARLESHTPPTS
ncbi:hypothetical protein LTS08_008598 [Lithohypha guttulata]|nr:hypothetical protein LTS08_008598 [Lithohypha guttulata]